MDLKLERKIEVIKLIIKLRWFYYVGIFLIELLGQSADNSLVNFPRILMIALLFGLLIANYVFLQFTARLDYKPSHAKANIFATFLLLFEISVFLFIMHRAGGVESIAYLFFILPIYFSSILFGLRGSLIFSFISGVSVSLIVYLESTGTIQHLSRYGEASLEATNLNWTSVKIGGIFLFYLIVGLAAGVASELISEREKDLDEKGKKLDEDRKKRSEELKKIDDTANLLVDRDRELSRINKELDKKIIELEEAEKSQMRAFRDLQMERKKTEDEKRKTDAIVSNFIDPILVFDKDHKISLFNPAATEILGLNEKHLGQQLSVENNFSLENFRKIFNFDYKVKTAKDLKIEDDAIEEITIIKADTSELTYKAITAKVVGKNDEFYGSMKIFYNLTREKMIDKLKSEFISIAAHQLRTPLSAIKWVMKMILDGDSGELNAEQKELLTKGYQSNERIIALVNDMLNVSRIEEGRFGYNFEQLSVEDILNTVVSSLEGRLREKKMKLFVNKPDKIPTIYMDKAKMTMVFQNLIENAVKYTPEFGTVQIDVEAGQKLLRVSVRDNGVGIPEADKAKLFSKFFRAGNVIRMQTEGSGLGLFIVKNVVEKHGGTIICNSEEGKGTEFVFTLPFTKPEEMVIPGK